MKRRTFVAGLCVLTSGVLGYRLGQSSREEQLDFQALLQGNTDVKFQHMPPELLIKLYTRNLAEQDRQAILQHLIHHNRSLFVAEPYARSLGTPGFYRVIG